MCQWHAGVCRQAAHSSRISRHQPAKETIMKLHSFYFRLYTRLRRPGFWLVLALSVVGMLVSGMLWMELPWPKACR